MPSIAFHTLGCKVNQYDTQAMLELFQRAGYQIVPFPGPADIYLINTCTVTGTGDKKSLQLARRLRREHPSCRLILCGCMAQSRPEALLKAGADLVLGTQRRMEVVSLLEQAVASGKPLCAVEPLNDPPYEPLTVSAQEEHTRATLKIQEGCDCRCSYCIIPDVRGPIRSRPLQDICLESERLRDAGYRELVLTGIHLSSYGRDLPQRLSLLDVLEALQAIPGILRIRLGSLEPTVVTDAFAAALGKLDKVCPQFHLALQSGSDTVLARMRRRYNTSQYLAAAERLRSVFPQAALTTDVLTGFPGETEAEFEETRAFLRRIGYARIHVFPYSPRPDTPAASMPGQLSSGEKERRARLLIADGQEMTDAWLRSWVGRESSVLVEESVNGCWEGYTPEYIRVRLQPDTTAAGGSILRVRLRDAEAGRMTGELL